MQRRFPIIPLLFISLFTLAQRSVKIDSVHVLLKKDKEDSLKVQHLRALSSYYKAYSFLDSAIYFGEIGIDLAKKLGLKREECDLCGNVGLSYVDQGKHAKAMNYYLQSLRLAEGLKDKRRMADNYVRIGSAYDEQNDYDKALKNYYTALSVYEQSGNKQRISMTTGNIGNVYYGLHQFEKALEFYLKALQVDKEMGNKANMKYSLGYIGMVYTELGKKNKQKQDSLFSEARKYYNQAMKISEEMNDRILVVNWIGNLGQNYSYIKNYKEAEKYVLRAIAMSDSLGLGEEKMEFEGVLSDIYYAKGDYKNSIDHYKIYSAEKDTMFNQEKNREITKHEMNYEFEKKMNGIKAKQEKREALAAAKSKQQKLIIISVICGLIIMAIAMLIVLKALRTTRLQKTIIERQKHLVDEKQKEIIDSINYAKRIQQSLLTNESYINKNINRMKK